MGYFFELELGRTQPAAMNSVLRYNVLGVGISALTLAEARDLVVGVRDQLRRGYICLGTAHGLTEAQRDDELRRIYNASWLTTPDGMPLVWLSPRGVERVYGPAPRRAACRARRRRASGIPGLGERTRLACSARRLAEQAPGGTPGAACGTQALPGPQPVPHINETLQTKSGVRLRSRCEG